VFFRYFVYITTNKNRTTLYVGVTGDIKARLAKHYQNSLKRSKAFTGKYNCYYLVYFEGFDSIHKAIAREKEIKAWRRQKKEQLISSFNPAWEFLNPEAF
jgi:putative endonuclease